MFTAGAVSIILVSFRFLFVRPCLELLNLDLFRIRYMHDIFIFVSKLLLTKKTPKRIELHKVVQDVDGLLTDVSVGRQVWGVNAANEIFRRDGQSWTKLPGLLTVISAADDGTVYGRNSTDNIFRWENNNWLLVGKKKHRTRLSVN
jgi:hypothetical protein